MNSRVIFPLIVALALFAMVPGLHADLWIRTIGWNAETTVYLEDNGKWVEVKVGDRVLSDFLKVKSTSPLLFYSEPPARRKSGEDPVEPAAVAEVPASSSQVLLIFSHRSQQDGAFSIRTVDDSPQAFPKGSARIFNYATIPVRCELFTKVQDLAAGEQAAWMFPSPLPRRTMFSLANRDERRWRTFASQSLDLVPEARALVFIYGREAIPTELRETDPSGEVLITPITPEPRPAFWIMVWDRRIHPPSQAAK